MLSIYEIANSSLHQLTDEISDLKSCVAKLERTVKGSNLQQNCNFLLVYGLGNYVSTTQIKIFHTQNLSYFISCKNLSKVCNKMSQPWDIRNLEDVLASNLENGEKIVNKNMSLLTAPGENYGSIMLRVDVDIRNEKTGKERKLNTVAKLIPDNEKIQEVFNTQLTYRNEYKFYEQIIPIFDKLLKDKGISSGADFAASFFGGRMNLDGSKVVNSDAIILMENLKSKGYTTGQKNKGFDLETSKVILDALAKFHAAGIALQYFEPQTFKDKLEPFFHFYVTPEIMYDKAMNAVVEKFADVGLTPAEIEVVAGYKKRSDIHKTSINKLWGTIGHNDSWTNNFLVKYEEGKPVNAIIVDFQVYDYRSPLGDVMFFLFTSVQQDIFEDSVDPLLEYYYNQIVGYLKTMGVDTRPFTRNSFDEEVKFAVKYYEYTHTLWMMFPIMHEEFKSVEDLEVVGTNWSKELLQKIISVTKICFKKGWLSVN